MVMLYEEALVQLCELSWTGCSNILLESSCSALDSLIYLVLGAFPYLIGKDISEAYGCELHTESCW